MKLEEETDEKKKKRINSFFERYIPLVSEIVEASKHGDTNVDEAVKTFTKTLKAFTKSLYNTEDVIDVNNTVMKQLAARDGFIDPLED